VLYQKAPKPVSNGRQMLIDAYALHPNNPANARQLLSQAINVLDRGSITPDPTEWPIDGPEVGRGHACMWGGIARVLLHQQAGGAFSVDATKADAWFGTAVLIFLETGEFTLAGRALQEWAESRRLLSDTEFANALNLGAVAVFSSANQPDRARLAGARTNATGPCNVDSSFFLQRPPTESEVSVLTTVLGGRNTQHFYDKTK
jgi:hypothetical protein